jgi:hypothetical protein
MGMRLVGSVMFLGVAILLFEIAGRLASEQRAGWGWFLVAGLMLIGIVQSVWNGEGSPPRCPRCPKPYSSHDLE